MIQKLSVIFIMFLLVIHSQMISPDDQSEFGVKDLIGTWTGYGGGGERKYGSGINWDY